MPNKDGKTHGDQFDAERYEEAVADPGVVEHYEALWSPKNIIDIEPNEAYDNYKTDKAIHQIIDYAGIDYLIDSMDAPLFGVNHREHSPTDTTLRMDIRADTGTSAMSELDKVLSASDRITIAPRFASRLKRAPDGGVEWFRITNLEKVADAVHLGALSPKTWTGGSVVAHMYDYGTLHDLDAVVYEYEGEGHA